MYSSTLVSMMVKRCYFYQTSKPPTKEEEEELCKSLQTNRPFTGRILYRITMGRMSIGESRCIGDYTKCVATYDSSFCGPSPPARGGVAIHDANIVWDVPLQSGIEPLHARVQKDSVAAPVVQLLLPAAFIVVQAMQLQHILHLVAVLVHARLQQSSSALFGLPGRGVLAVGASEALLHNVVDCHPNQQRVLSKHVPRSHKRVPHNAVCVQRQLDVFKRASWEQVQHVQPAVVVEHGGLVWRRRRHRPLDQVPRACVRMVQVDTHVEALVGAGVLWLRVAALLGEHVASLLKQYVAQVLRLLTHCAVAHNQQPQRRRPRTALAVLFTQADRPADRLGPL
eukprot:363125-Chlamydomonas_euryale.AAC.5